MPDQLGQEQRVAAGQLLERLARGSGPAGHVQRPQQRLHIVDPERGQVHAEHSVAPLVRPIH